MDDVSIVAIGDENLVDPRIMDQESDLVKKTGIRPSFDKEASYVAIDGTKLVGILWAGRNRDKVDMDIAIDPAYQSKKIGSRMIYNQLKDWKDEAVDLKTKIEINCVNPRLKEWLLKNGFKQHKSIPNYVVRDLNK